MNQIRIYINSHSKLFTLISLGIIFCAVFIVFLFYNNYFNNKSDKFLVDADTLENNTDFPTLPTPKDTANDSASNEIKSQVAINDQTDQSIIAQESDSSSDNDTSDNVDIDQDNSSNNSNDNTDTLSDSTSQSSGIEIRGNDTCNTETTAALNLLSSSAVSYFSNVQVNIGVIECVDSGSGMYVWENPPRFAAGADTRNAGTMWYAGSIAHDSCHSRQYKDGRDYSGRDAEAECLNFQYGTLEAMGADQSTLDYVKNIIDSEYWEIPVDERWW